MADLISIPGLGKASLELLEAAGFHNAEALARAGVEELADELERANSILKISKRAPTYSVVEKWVFSAREIVGMTEAAAGPSLMPVNYEETSKVSSMLASAPVAIPLPARTLVENRLGVADIPAAILLNRYSGDLDVRVDQRLPKGRQPLPSSGPSYVQIAENVNPRIEIDTSRFRSTEDVTHPSPKGVGIRVSPADDRVALIRAPRSSTNQGRDPHSRWYIRGVLHSHPFSIFMGAAVTLLLMIMIPVSLISAGLLLASVEMPQFFGWVPGWLLVFPVSLPLFGIAYLIFGLGGSCRICGQKLFSQRAHFKNSRAHHVRGLGYIFPLCLQILTFRWFRCTHCGTPVRLKE